MERIQKLAAPATALPSLLEDTRRLATPPLAQSLEMDVDARRTDAWGSPRANSAANDGAAHDEGVNSRVDDRCNEAVVRSLDGVTSRVDDRRNEAVVRSFDGLGAAEFGNG